LCTWDGSGLYFQWASLNFTCMRILDRPLLLVIGLILLIALAFGIFSQQRKFDWERSYEEDRKQPFDSYLLYEQMENLFAEAEVKKVRKPVFDQLVYQPKKGSLYFFVNEELPLYKESLRELLAFVEEGNQVFMAAGYFLPKLIDELDLRPVPKIITLDEMGDAVQVLPDVVERPKDSIQLFLRSTQHVYTVAAGDVLSILPEVDKAHVETLGTDEDGNPNFLRVAYGKGFFYLHSHPALFSNYYLLNKNIQPYIESVFSEIPAIDTLYLDAYYKPSVLRSRRRDRGDGNNENSSPERDSIWDYMMEKPALAWGLWLAIAGVLLFVLSEVKRKQRIIPIIRPLPNTTLQFTETIGRLYFQRSDHRNLALKRIRVLLDYIRQVYYLKTSEIDGDFYETLSAKSGLSPEDIEQLFGLIAYIQEAETISLEVLVKLNEKVEAFYREGAR